MTERPSASEGSLDSRNDPASDAARVEAVLASAATVRRVGRMLRIAGAVVVALGLLAGLALAIAVIASGFAGVGPQGEGPGDRESAIRSWAP